ncbi:MAG: AbrB/MazE/SpoVT family DNA-binding domain-containing protein [Nanoarchaeota archaeon]
MKRKAIQLANQTIVVSLPSKWVKQEGIKKGDDIDVQEKGKDLVISTDSSINEKIEGEVNLINDSEITIGVLVGNLCSSGFDRIKINYNNEKQYNILQNILRDKIIGFDVIKTEKNYCIIENITEPSENQFDNILRKLFQNIEELFELTAKRLEGNNENTKLFYEVEDRIFKYESFCRRVIAKRRLPVKNTEMLLNFIMVLINAQRELYHLNKFLENNKISVYSKELKKLLKDAYSMFGILKECFFNRKIEPLGRIHETENRIIKENLYPLLEKNNKKENVLVYHMGVCMRQLHLAASPLIGFIL